MPAPIVRVMLNPVSDHGVLDDLTALLEGHVDAVDLVGLAGPDDAPITVRVERPAVLEGDDEDA